MYYAAKKPLCFSGFYQAIDKTELRIVIDSFPAWRNCAYVWIRRYIREVRPNHLKKPTERSVFVGMRSGDPLTNRALTEFLAYRLKRAGLKRIAPYRLRASAATHMVTAGMNIGFVQ